MTFYELHAWEVCKTRYIVQHSWVQRRVPSESPSSTSQFASLMVKNIAVPDRAERIPCLAQCPVQ